MKPRLGWPLPALLVWGLAWSLYLGVRAAGGGVAPALLAALAAGA